ncbi:predicted protein [Sclerotinia sclerotiorum 1980 UF-70]|uniref:Uncharacterized protein n=1 Tax=Sclerotinia sclerotiorum (strain ATCC 18683 / 1980 / Ss-1) TaxID=665079 RepID=A7EG24_SCLS1|nr:predicted protein [Sclerotinia sclerotiorum 1980 UF-70]EDO01790.1 predicted protein [Sclerotinia sclerotiorum 1980 UF-70]
MKVKDSRSGECPCLKGHSRVGRVPSNRIFRNDIHNKIEIIVLALTTAAGDTKNLQNSKNESVANWGVQSLHLEAIGDREVIKR